jgi:hypothetical protein
MHGLPRSLCAVGLLLPGHSLEGVFVGEVGLVWFDGTLGRAAAAGVLVLLRRQSCQWLGLGEACENERKGSAGLSWTDWTGWKKSRRCARASAGIS